MQSESQIEYTFRINSVQSYKTMIPFTYLLFVDECKLYCYTTIQSH